MRIFTLAIVLILNACQAVFAQCDVLASLQVTDLANEVLFADTECTDPDGWTHYFNEASGKILLSIKKNGQDIGSLDLGMTVKAGTLPGFGAAAFNLSNADYIDNDIWVIANRYWQIIGANAISSPVSVRFYFSETDVNDIAGAVDDFGFFVDEPDDLLVFTLGNGNGLDPLATVTQPSNAVFTLYDMVPGPAPDWTGGEFNGFPFGEFEVSTLDIGGGAGFLIFTQNDLLFTTGNIAKPNSVPVPEVTVEATSINMAVTDAAGNYAVPDLLAGEDYELTPTKDIDHAQYISVADLVAISQHILGVELFSSPFQYIAADADHDEILTAIDLVQIRDVLLGNASDFPGNESWRFVPESYIFPDPNNPFSPPFPESILVVNLTDSLFNQDFTGVKIGDVVDDAAIAPPNLNTTFSLQDLSACNVGDTVAFSMEVSDFQNIMGFQFTLGWDEAVMEFLEAENFNLPDFAAGSVGTTAAGDGKLTFAWISLNPNGNSVADGTAICELKFIVNGNLNDATPLIFTNTPTDLLLLHQNLSQVTPATLAGSLTINNSSAIAATATLTPPGCNGEPVGAIDLILTAGMAPFGFLWSTGAITEDLAGIAGGTYSVTVSDASGGCPMVFSFQLPLTSSFVLDGVTFDMTCPYLVDGEIDLDVSGGVPPYDFAWSNGSDEEDPANLYEGSYSVTVTDAAGCTGTAEFEIENPNRINPVVMVTNASSASALDGIVMILEINNGTQPFEFQWNTGATTQSLDGVPAGDYVVTITDGLGCQHVFGYEVFGLFTSVFEMEGAPVSVSAFPNPAMPGQFFDLWVESAKPGEISAAIFSPAGKLVSRNVFGVTSGQQLRQLIAPDKRGFYFIQIKMDDRLAGWLKLVVQ